MLAQFWAISTVADGIKLRYLLLSCDFHSTSRSCLDIIPCHALHAWTTLKSIKGAPMSPKVSTGYTVYQLVVLICKGIYVFCAIPAITSIQLYSFIHLFIVLPIITAGSCGNSRDTGKMILIRYIEWHGNQMQYIGFGHDVIYHITLSLKRKSKWQLSVQPVIPSKWHRYPSRRMWTDHLLSFPFSSRTWNCVVI